MKKPNLTKTALLSVTIMSLLVTSGCSTKTAKSDNNYDQKPALTVSHKKGQKVVSLMQELQSSGYRPQELMQLFNANKSLMNVKQKQQAATLIYQSAQNSCLYYNHYAQMLSGELHYSMGNQPNLQDPLKHLQTLNNNTVTGFVRDTQNQMITSTYIGKDAIYVEPNFAKIKEQVGKYANKDLKEFLDFGIQQQKNQPISADSVSIKQAAANFSMNLQWLSAHRKSAFKSDASTLANKQFQTIFGTFTDNNYLSKKKGTLKPEVIDGIKALAKQQNTDYILLNNSKIYLKKLSGNVANTQTQGYFQNKANTLFGNSKYKDDAGNSASVLSGATKNTKQTAALDKNAKPVENKTAK